MFIVAVSWSVSSAVSALVVTVRDQCVSLPKSSHDVVQVILGQLAVQTICDTHVSVHHVLTDLFIDLSVKGYYLPKSTLTTRNWT